MRARLYIIIMRKKREEAIKSIEPIEALETLETFEVILRLITSAAYRAYRAYVHLQLSKSIDLTFNNLTSGAKRIIY